MGGEEGAFLGTGLQVTFGAFLLGEKRKRKKKPKKEWRRWEGKFSQMHSLLCSLAFGEGQRSAPPRGQEGFEQKFRGRGTC